MREPLCVLYLQEGNGDSLSVGDRMSRTEEFDVVIVGAGLAGLICM